MAAIREKATVREQKQREAREARIASQPISGMVHSIVMHKPAG
jgi:hypothetical protein